MDSHIWPTGQDHLEPIQRQHQTPRLEELHPRHAVHPVHPAHRADGTRAGLFPPPKIMMQLARLATWVDCSCRAGGCGRVWNHANN